MFFRRERPKTLTFDDHLQSLKSAGFTTTTSGSGQARVERKGIAAVVAAAPEAGKVAIIERAGLVMGKEIGALVDRGFQKTFRTASGKELPALADHLKAVHAFQEDLREAVGLTSLYNEGLGTVSRLYLYDRVQNRDAGVPQRPWEVKTVNAERP